MDINVHNQCAYDTCNVFTYVAVIYSVLQAYYVHDYHVDDLTIQF